MSSPDTIDALNRVLNILARSFPQYMRYARPYIPPGRENVMETISDIVAGQDALAERVTHTIFESDGTPDPGDFPIVYTDLHDLAIDFLIRQAIAYQKQTLDDLQQSVDALRLAPAAQSLAAEALGMAKAHLELLQAIEGSAGQSTIVHDRAPAFANDMPVSTEASGTPHRQQDRKLLAGDPNAPS
jgi:bacterioferritin (cytochrome b1)